MMNNCRMHKYRMDSGETVRTLNELSTESRSHLRAHTLSLIVICLFGVSGCRSFRPSDGEGLFAKSDLLSTDSIRGPLERVLYSEDEGVLEKGQKFSARGRRQVEAARKQFDEGKYAAALKNYKAIANKYEESAIGEEAWFRIGECHYAMKQYPHAQDAYDKLFADYPSTKYVSDASQRLFSIASIWLEISEPASKSQIKTVSQQVKVDNPAKTNASSSAPSVRFGLIPNFFDETRPFLDTRGRARKALKSVWLNDPTGPIADDALMLTATYYLRQGNSIEADRYFEILRQEYPESPHLEDAFVLGSHAKQMSYQGPYYDNTSLVSAKNLKEQTLSMFPNSESREQVREDLKKLYLYEAQDAWADVQFYQRKDNPSAVAIHCQRVIEDFPDTRYAELARRTILQIDPAAYRRLPGLTDFVKSLPTESMAPQRSQERPSGTPVKSVSAPNDKKRRFRLPGF